MSPKKPIAAKLPPKTARQGNLVFRRYRVDPRTGKIMDAHAYGHKAWPIRIKR